ncbi:hypothetical protein DXG03_002531 [Asterophora parasitica]|uniref:Uncharacterized protein n=1 Tax=Asterophora parasitica TaxID=117018 RepID=A0A9P7G8A9_9AGAR|nr:hypothetical protein DXG03_002531 [Asterophora parasitica]
MPSAMQCEVDETITDQFEEDQDSLFGSPSPPSSPIKGRSPSPALALPSASNSTQNVGTIALPGSHDCSELPVDPLALSLNDAFNELHHRPPAIPAHALSLTAQASSSSSSSWSRASSAGPSCRPRKKTCKKMKSKEATPRPPPPEIPLPDPSGPVPANWLRNQSALLGTAGLVGGVTPANLSIHRHTRGTNASNPIVVEDEEEQPSVLRRSSEFRQPYAKPIDPSLLPTPSTQDVVAMLIGQKDIFPVLESILRLIAAGSAPQTAIRAPQGSTPISFRSSTQSSSSSSSGPPPKKRKLNRVPAGAVDWDVPYPFPEGQGPDSYRTTWERDRGKQLITQLVTLIKSAARKAATKIYYQNEQVKQQLMESQRAAFAQIQASIMSTYANEPKVHGHYRPSTVTYGLEGEAAAAARAQAQEVLADNGKTSGAAPTPSPYQLVQTPSSGSAASGPQPSTPFDQLISSLLAATPNQSAPPNQVTATTRVTGSCATVSAVGTSSIAFSLPGGNQIPASSTAPASGGMESLNQGLFDNWMSILQTFPMPSEQSQNQTPTQHLLAALEQSQASTPTSTTTSDFNFSDFDQQCLDPNYIDTFDLDSIFGSSGTSLIASSSTDAPSASHDDNIDAHFAPQSDIAIDPALLAMSIPPARSACVAPTSVADKPPSLAASPMPSLSSLGDADPTTPNSAAWDLSMPDIFTGTTGDAPSTDTNNLGIEHADSDSAGQGGAEDYVNALMGVPAHGLGQEKEVTAMRVDKGKGRDMGETLRPLLLPTVTPMTSFASVLASASQSTHTPFQSSGPTFATKPSTVQLSMFASKPTASAPSTVRTADRTLNKADVMRRAAERKKALMSEIDNIRTQLWETTIEQGVLSHMSKLFSTSSGPGGSTTATT